MLSLKVQVPFWICTLIWGTTWIVIRDQLGVVPASWSVTYRFILAGAAMFAWAAITRQPLRLGNDGQRLAMLFGLAQFALNFNFVYRAEEHITSGLVALLFALLIVPNTLFARLFLGQRVSLRFFAGSAVAIAGIALLFVQEYRTSGGGSAIALGIGLTLCGVLSASAANILQATQAARRQPMASLLAWGMLWGTLINAAWAWSTVGAPVIELRLGYIAGIAHLGLLASAVAFMAYFSVIRAIGPGPAAYSGIITPVIAMGFSTVFEDYRWSLLAVAGGGLTMAGLVIALTARRPDAKSG
jgi:drug/metabolite transporter (DMT)-like permease